MADKDGWVYVLTNEAMPGLVKVGQTYKTPEIRAQELSSETGVAAQYVVVYKAFVPNYDQVEKVVHDKLKSAGKHYNKEFFKCEPFEAIQHIQDSATVKFEECDEEYEILDDLLPELDEHIHIGNTDLVICDNLGRAMQGYHNWKSGYFGYWKNGRHHGHGTMFYKDGRHYVGDWVNNVYHGNGTLTGPNYGEYTGQWWNGKRHGQGKLTTPDGTILVGEWEDDSWKGELINDELNEDFEIKNKTQKAFEEQEEAERQRIAKEKSELESECTFMGSPGEVEEVHHQEESFWRRLLMWLLVFFGLFILSFLLNRS